MDTALFSRCYLRFVWSGSECVSASLIISCLVSNKPNHVYTAHFSENWGYLSMSPMIAGNLFSILFGWNLDRNEDKATTPAPNSISVSSTTAITSLNNATAIAVRGSLPSTEVRCSRGPECYVNSIYVTIAATILAIGLSIWAGVRDRRKISKALRSREG